MRTNRLSFVIIIACAFYGANLGASDAKLETPKRPVTDEYQGVKVEDAYQWLENDSDTAVKSWSDAQNQRPRAYIDKLPDRAAVEKQLMDWFAKTSPSYSGL